jgi:heme/copper-type cytochrome/quinol oxidase subunit 2
MLYLMDEVSDPSMSVLAEGHQWYWSYQYPDFLNDEDEFIEFDSYLVPEFELERVFLADNTNTNTSTCINHHNPNFFFTVLSEITDTDRLAYHFSDARLNNQSTMVHKAGIKFTRRSWIARYLRLNHRNFFWTGTSIYSN